MTRKVLNTLQATLTMAGKEKRIQTWFYFIFSNANDCGILCHLQEKIKSKMYTLLLQLYLATNAVWVLCMYVEYNNRIAYLSWFLYPIVLIYPFVNTNWSKNRMKILSKVVTYHLLFTLFMNLIYYGGLNQLISIWKGLQYLPQHIIVQISL